MASKQRWIKMTEKPRGLFNVRQWQHVEYRSWRIVEGHSESSELRFSVTNPESGSALPKFYPSFNAAVEAAKDLANLD